MTDNFPDDDNGAVLRRMHQSGDDLTVERKFDFLAVLPNEIAARDLAQEFSRRGLETSVAKTGIVDGRPWDVVIRINMIPTHQAITDFERQIQLAAEARGGRTDGWGCFEVKQSES